MPTRTELGLVCPYCAADPDTPCEAVDADPLNGRCLIQGELDLDEHDADRHAA
jgi:hypothetical protein